MPTLIATPTRITAVGTKPKIIQEYVGRVGVSPESYARMAAFAVSQPEDVDVNELIFRPTAQEL